MSVVFAGEYLGLPIPSDDEHEMVQAYLRTDGDDGQVPVKNLYEMVENKRPHIRVMVDSNKSEYFDDDDDDNVTPEVMGICDGIESGYEFMVGCITYIHFLRSGQLSLEEFLSNLPKNTPILPLRKNSQLRRIQKVVAGRAIFDLAHEEEIEDSSELAYKDTQDYLYYAKNMATIIEDEAKYLDENEDYGSNQESPFVWGFNLAVDNAIEMYIQSYEQQVLNKSGLCSVRFDFRI